MSSKEKLLESAQKFIAKGQIPRAIKDYQKVVEIDPKDIRSRQKLAELYSRVRMNAEAADCLEGVAQHFVNHGFHLKAIAVYKQIQRLNPGQSGIYLKLAELNQKQGLLGDALAEYKNLAAFYEKGGMLPEALNVLQKMRDIEPENLNIRVKIVETHLQAGKRDQARSELGETLSILESKRDLARLQKLYEFFLPRFHRDPDLRSGLARTLIRKGEPERGIVLLREMLDETPKNEGVLELMADGCRECGNFAGEREILLQLLLLRPDDLELRARIVGSYLDGAEFSSALHFLEEWNEAFHEKRKAPVLKSLYERLDKLMPGEARIRTALQSIHDMIGEGGESPDILSGASEPSGEAAHAELPAEEVLTVAIPEEPGEQKVKAEFLPPPETADFEIQEGAEEIPLEFLLEVALFSDTSDDAEAPPEPAGTEAAGLDVEMELELDFDLDMPKADSGCVSAPLPHEQDADADILASLSFEEVEDGALVEHTDPLAAVLEEGTAQSASGSEAAASSQPKKGIKTDFEVEDPESYYNLGIAYREMGLLDDAVSAFEKAMGDPGLVVACLILKGLCLADKGLFQRAEATFKDALGWPGLAGGERMCLHFELGLLHERQDHPMEALEYFATVAAADSFFRDAGEKVRSLRRQLGLPQEGDPGESTQRRKDRVSYV